MAKPTAKQVKQTVLSGDEDQTINSQEWKLKEKDFVFVKKGHVRPNQLLPNPNQKLKPIQTITSLNWK